MNWEFNHARPQNGKEVIALRQAVRSRLFAPQARKQRSEACTQPKTRTRAMEPYWAENETWFDDHVDRHKYFVANSIKATTYIMCWKMGEDYDEVLGPGRFGNLIKVRFAIWHHLYRTGKHSLTQIGRVFGKDHTTILNGIRKFEA